MSRKRKRKSAEQKEKERLENWIAQFHELGIHSEEEVYELLFENPECVDLPEETVEKGYTEEPPWDDSKGGLYPDSVHISTYKDKYIVWFSGGDTGDEFIYEPDYEDFANVYDTLEEARIRRDLYPYGEDPKKKQIMDCREKLNDDGFWFSEKFAGWPDNYNFTVFYTYQKQESPLCKWWDELLFLLHCRRCQFGYDPKVY